MLLYELRVCKDRQDCLSTLLFMSSRAILKINYYSWKREKECVVLRMSLCVDEVITALKYQKEINKNNYFLNIYNNIFTSFWPFQERMWVGCYYVYKIRKWLFLYATAIISIDPSRNRFHYLIYLYLFIALPISPLKSWFLCI